MRLGEWSTPPRLHFAKYLDTKENKKEKDIEKIK